MLESSPCKENQQRKLGVECGVHIYCKSGLQDKTPGLYTCCTHTLECFPLSAKLPLINLSVVPMSPLGSFTP